MKLAKYLADTRKDAPKQKKIEVRVPGNIRRKMIGSKWYKIERNDR